MKKPTVENPKLQNIVDGIWATGEDVIGDGSLADAIRHEKATGKKTKGYDHSQKGKEIITRLETWLRSKTSPKPASDKKIAREIIKDIRQALKGD